MADVFDLHGGYLNNAILPSFLFFFLKQGRAKTQYFNISEIKILFHYCITKTTSKQNETWYYLKQIKPSLHKLELEMEDNDLHHACALHVVVLTAVVEISNEGAIAHNANETSSFEKNHPRYNQICKFGSTVKWRYKFNRKISFQLLYKWDWRCVAI